MIPLIKVRPLAAKNLLVLGLFILACVTPDFEGGIPSLLKTFNYPKKSHNVLMAQPLPDPVKPIKLTALEEDWLRAHPTIRVGVDPVYAPYSFRDQQGHYRGIVLEFMSYLEKRLTIKMEIVPDLDWPRIVDGVRKKSLDLVATMTYRPERDSFVNFTEIYLPTPLAIMRRSGDHTIQSESDIDGRSIALVEGYASSARVMEEYPLVKPVMVKTTLEGLFAVAVGKADAYVGVLGINLYLIQENGIPNLEAASIYGAGKNGQRFGVRKDWPELATILDKALKAMPASNKRKLFEKWLKPHPTLVLEDKKSQDIAQLNLTVKEKAWLVKHPRIEVGTMDAWPPFDYLDDTGKPSGIGAEYIRMLNKRLNNVLVVVPGSWTDIYGAVKAKKLDVLLDITPLKNREPYFNFTRPYLSVPHVIVAQKQVPYLRDEDDLVGKTLALEKGFGNVMYFTEKYPGVVVKEFANTAEALEAVARGQVDAYAGNRAVATYLIEKNVMMNLKIHGPLKKQGSILAIGVRKDWPEFTKILEKAMDSITPDELITMNRRWLGLPSETSQTIALSKSSTFNQTKFMIQTLGIACALILVVILIFWIVRGRPKHLLISDLHFLVSFVFAGLIIAIGVLITFLIEGEKEQNTIENHRFNSFALALELKQSSDDLTRFARTYVVTGDFRYKTYFDLVSEIRDGLRPHPGNYTRAYWDHIAAGKAIFDEEGETYSIEDRIIKLGLTEEEKKLLTLAKRESDDLIDFEQVAMNAVQGLFKDEKGDFTLYKKPDKEFARSLMHGQYYHDAKSRIMKPIDEFIILFQNRINESLRKIRIKNNALISGITVLICITIGLAFLFFYLLKNKIISPLKHLEETAMNIAEGERNMVVQVQGRNEISQMADAFNSMLTEQRKAEEAIKIAKEQAEAANRAKSTFLANMSHEIRTPMNAILGHAQILQKDGDLNARQLQSIRSINRSGEHLLLLINDILDISKIEAGKVKVSPVSFRLHTLLEEIKELFRFRIQQKNIDFDIDISPDLPDLIRADESRLRQIILNLLGNAIKFTEQGSIMVQTALKGNVIELNVSDTGCGIPQDRLESIFQAFEQAETGSRFSGGTGLGLAISRQIARLMGGDILVQSTLHQGSRFSLTFAFGKGDTKDLQSEIPNAIVKRIKPDQPDIKVLIVDDREENITVARMMLEPVGFTIKEATDGQEALRLYEQWLPDIILMDIVMPEMDGLEATQKIRKIKSSKKTAIIAVSASALDEERARVLQQGADAFIKKPIKASELYETIRHYTGIDYEYEEPFAADEPITDYTQTREMITRLPDEIKRKISQAAVLGKINMLNHAAAELSQTNKHAADYLQGLIDNFELETIGNLFK